MQKTNSLVFIIIILIYIFIPIHVDASQASCYGILYAQQANEQYPLDTRQVAIDVCNSLDQMEYDSTAYTTPYTSSGSQPGSTVAAYNRLKSDNVFFFDGHGGESYLSFSEGTTTGGTWNEYQSFVGETTSGNIKQSYMNRISDFSAGELDDMLLAVFLSCHSAESHAVFGSLIDETTYRGADTAIGFVGTIDDPQSGNWARYFFQKQNEGYNYNDSALMASLLIQSNDPQGNSHGLQNFMIKGLKSEKITPARGGYQTITTYPISITSGQGGFVDPISSDPIQSGQTQTINVQLGSEKHVLVSYNRNSYEIDTVVYQPPSGASVTLTGTNLGSYNQPP